METITTTGWREQCSAATAVMADDWTAQVRSSMAQTILVTGQALRAMKPLMPQCFEAWWRAELGLNDRKTVSDLMTASELLEAQPSDTMLATLPARTLAVLQRAGASAAGVAAERLADGQRVTEAGARRIASNEGGEQPGFGLSTTAMLRCMGYLNDDRANTLASLLKGRNAAMKQAEHLGKALDFDAKYGSMTGDERFEAADAGVDNPLLQAWFSAVTDSFRLNGQIQDFRDWTVEHPVAHPSPDNPCWSRAFEGNPVVEIWNTLMELEASYRRDLAGHRNPDGAIRQVFLDLAQPRGRAATAMETMLALVPEGWESWVKGYLAGASDEAKARKDA